MYDAGSSLGRRGPCRRESKTQLSMESPFPSETKEREPRHTASGPLRATKLRSTLLIASSGIVVLPSFRIGVTSTGSHLMGTYFQFSSVFDVRVILGFLGSFFTFAAEKISLTDWDISGPIPSPSISVTVYLPYENKKVSHYSLRSFF